MHRLGVDLGGTNIAAGIVTEDGEILYKASTPTLSKRGWQAVIKDIADLCYKLAADANIPMDEIASLGVGSPGSVNPRDGIVTYASNINFLNTPVCAELAKYIDKPVFIENDANAAALAESVGGAAKGYGDSITITLGTGIGGGIIVNGKIITGSFFGGGEVGHHVIVVDGEQCSCGRKGCWEAYASATALIRDAKKAFGDKYGEIDAKTVFDAKENGDETAAVLIDNYIKYTAEGLVNLINIFQPEIILMGGGVCAQGEKFLEPIRDMIRSRSYGGGAKLKTAIKAASLGNDAGLIGAAMLYRLK